MQAVLIILVVGVAIFLNYAWAAGRSDDMLDSWARKHGYQIIKKQYRMLLRGPYFLASTKGQSVYRMTVIDNTGRTRTCWARCGGFMLGMLSDRVDVEWD